MERRTETSTSLSGDNHQLLAVSALFEIDLSVDWIEELTCRKPSQILSVLEEGVRQGWLMKKGPGVFGFADLKERQRLQALLSAEERQRLHLKIAGILMKELPEEEPKVLGVARHLLHVTNDIQSCQWLVRAGDLLLKNFQAENALQCYAKALQDLSLLMGEEADRLFARTAIQYSKISTARHDTTKVLSLLEEAIVRAQRWNVRNALSLLEMHLAKNEWLCSRYSSAIRHFEQGWAMAKEIDDPKLLRSATTFSTFFSYWQGRFDRVVSSYEKAVPDVEKYPQGRFPLLATMIVGRCYAYIGQITQGLGMLDSMRTYCREKGDRYLAAQAGFAMGDVMLDIRRLPDALQYLKSTVEEARREHNEWIRISGLLALAFTYFLIEDPKRSLACLSEFLEHRTQSQVSVLSYSYLMDLCWAMEQGKLPRIAGLSLEREVDRSIQSLNSFMKGIAYRYQALLQRQAGSPEEKVSASLELSLKWLEESCHQIELANSQMELARFYLAQGYEEKARELTRLGSKILSPINEGLIPEDLRPLIRQPLVNEPLIKDILKLGQELGTIRSDKDLIQHILSAGNRITGAERGAIFLIEGEEDSRRLRLRASKNLTSEQITHDHFQSSMKMIEEVTLSKRGQILGTNSTAHSGELIRSRIAVPMILWNKVVGVLYHDNRLLSSAFKESDLELLAYFAALAAVGMDNATAYKEIQRLNQRLKEEKLYYEEQHLQTLHFEDIVGESPAIRQVLAQVNQVAATDTTVLILGETGVGKELVARAIHRHSARQGKPFIRVFCSALPDSLIPSELFGHEKGSFTGAMQRRIGRFELADEGTLFLDEVGDLSLEVQVRLLRVLQSKEFERVGGNETLRSDFRLLAATNRDLEQEVNTQRFRADLYYRLNVFPLYVPPLRERKEDIPLLAQYFLQIYAQKMQKTFENIPDGEVEKLRQYDWPGNIRELENIIERGVILSKPPHFRLPTLSTRHSESVRSKPSITLKDNERTHILWALQKTGWKVRGKGGAAELLEIHPSTLAFRMKKLGIRRPSASAPSKPSGKRVLPAGPAGSPVSS